MIYNVLVTKQKNCDDRPRTGGTKRLSYTDNNGNLEIVEENNYYPFGLKHKGYNNVVNGTENNHKRFQGQEISKELGYNMYEYKWRHYDASIGRFNVIDPLATDFPQWAPYVFSGNYVTISKELEGLEPEFMINGDNGLNSDNELTQPMVTLLNAAFGYSPESLTGTTWLRDSDPRAHWFATKVVPDNAVAITWGRQVVYDRTISTTRSNRRWFSLIAHEQKHRSDIDTYGSGLFYLSYIIEGARVGGGHDDLGHEKVANEDEAYAEQLWNYNGGEVQNIFNMGSLTGNQMSAKMESVGARFRRDVILTDQISGAESSLKTVIGALDGLGNSKEDRNIKAALGGLINSINQSIKDAKKEQKDITKKYGY
ncbi:RHS repeat-associated core domain-containing protein [Flagellimonas sp.]|jgi:RHS repeat-associated protein|uniref:RHS repeat-associated core domain-containing protein n=1 Tax=Flagellimonas sp. TaxID=2058762 RepID=UPI003BAA2ED9